MHEYVLPALAKINPEEPVREVTCRGCIDNESNQLAHMNPGGCLCGEDDGED